MVDCRVNNDCANAYSIYDTPFFDVSTVEFSTGEGFETNSSAYSCNGLNPQLKTNWYRILANKSTCFNANFKFSASSGIFVYEGETCDSLECVDEVVYGYSAVDWQAKEGKVYFIAVGLDAYLGTEDYIFTLSVRDIVILSFFLNFIMPLTKSWIRYDRKQACVSHQPEMRSASMQRCYLQTQLHQET
jgi:hypothetical protein